MPAASNTTRRGRVWTPEQREAQRQRARLQPREHGRFAVDNLMQRVQERRAREQARTAQRRQSAQRVRRQNERLGRQATQRLQTLNQRFGIAHGTIIGSHEEQRAFVANRQEEFADYLFGTSTQARNIQNRLIREFGNRPNAYKQLEQAAKLYGESLNAQLTLNGMNKMLKTPGLIPGNRAANFKNIMTGLRNVIEQNNIALQNITGFRFGGTGLAAPTPPLSNRLYKIYRDQAAKAFSQGGVNGVRGATQATIRTGEGSLIFRVLLTDLSIYNSIDNFQTAFEQNISAEFNRLAREMTEFMRRNHPWMNQTHRAEETIAARTHFGTTLEEQIEIFNEEGAPSANFSSTYDPEALVSSSRGGITITLQHGVYYGVYLEYAHEGRYAIIRPTWRRYSARVTEAIRRAAQNAAAGVMQTAGTAGAAGAAGSTGTNTA